MKLIHYSRYGYNGNFTYTSVCGKNVETHHGKEESSIHPEEANCKKCMATEEYKKDLADLQVTLPNMKRRIYIESDILQANEFKSSRRVVREFVEDKGLKCVDRVFSEVLDFAWHDLEKTWKAVKSADEIYTDSSLMPLIGNSYTGAPVIFNGMCERAVKESVIGKSVIILNTPENIDWYMIDIPLMKKAFKKNTLYTYNAEYEIEKVNVSKIKKK